VIECLSSADVGSDDTVDIDDIANIRIFNHVDLHVVVGEVWIIGTDLSAIQKHSEDCIKIGLIVDIFIQGVADEVDSSELLVVDIPRVGSLRGEDVDLDLYFVRPFATLGSCVPDFPLLDALVDAHSALNDILSSAASETSVRVKAIYAVG
jgi:hypothetical protein